MPLVLVSYTGDMMDSQGTNMALPHMEKDFGWDGTVAQWLLAVYYLGQAATSIPIAKVAQRAGEPVVFLLCQVAIVLGNVGCSLARDPILFCVIHMLVGMATAG